MKMTTNRLHDRHLRALRHLVWGGVGLWLGAVTLGASAQGALPAELAAQALNAPAVKAAISARSASAAKPQSPTLNEHEIQLGTIRQAILEATMERPTRVISSAWVDEKGALHESAHFHSEAHVRGVRVMSYVQDDQPQTRVSAEVLPWGWRQTSSDKSCSAPPRPWRLPLVIHAHAPDGFSGPEHFATHSVLSQAHEALLKGMQSSQRWRSHGLTTVDNNSYHRALMGHEEAPSGWVAEISLKPHVHPVQTRWTQHLGMGKTEPVWHWILTLTLGQRHFPGERTEPKWHMEQIIAISPNAMIQNPSAWSRQLSADLQQHMRHWVSQLDKRTECEPVQFHVRRTGKDALQLQAGLGSGLRPGDRVLLMNPSHVPSRMLEANVAQHLALAQVVRVGNNRTELQQLAGPALTSNGPWMALPL